MNTDTSRTAPVESLENAAEAVTRAKVLLTSATVDSLRYCEAELAAAIESLENLRRHLDADANLPVTGVPSLAQRIQRDVTAFSALLNQAREFHAGLEDLSASSLAGYTASGAAAKTGGEHSRIEMKG